MNRYNISNRKHTWLNTNVIDSSKVRIPTLTVFSEGVFPLNRVSDEADSLDGDVL